MAVTALLACFSAAVLVPSSASADKIADKRAQAARIAAQIERNYEKMSALDEQLNEANNRIATLQTEIKRTSAEAAVAKGNMSKLQRALAVRAASLYRNAGTDAAGTNADTIQQEGAQSVYAQSTAAKDRDMIDEFRRARDASIATEQRLSKAQDDAERQAKAAKDARAALAATNASQQQLLTQTKGELAGLIAEEQARQDRIAADNARAAARRAEQQRQAEADRQARDNQNRGGVSTGGSNNSGSSNGGSSGPPPPSHIVARNPRVQLAIDTAMAQRGKWYQYAAAGPDRFDCSGLLVYSWGKVGVYLPHSSRALYASLPHIAMSQLQPGDFVYYGSPIHHVGMYIGGGMMVEAPHTGAQVRTRSIYRNDYAGATRVP